jgi:predicted N-acetyltransferase YhbS
MMAGVLRGLQVRPTEADDRPAALGVVEQAFATPTRAAGEELEIVWTVWQLGATPPGTDLVATFEDEVVGHVLGSWGSLAGHPVLGLAPSP